MPDWHDGRMPGDERKTALISPEGALTYRDIKTAPNCPLGVDGKQRQCGVCAACMLRRMSLHAAGITEPADTYVWENLGASDFQSGAAPGFKLATKALEQYAIAGVLHLDHLAALPHSALHRRLIRRSAREVAEALGESLIDTEMKLLSMLERHRDEWRSFLTSLGPDSFVTKLSSAFS